MPERGPVLISGAVEGLLDEAVVKRLITHVGGRPGPIYGKSGKTQLLRRLEGYNQAARFAPWAILVDLDQDAECAPPFRTTCLAEPAPNLCFRIAVREVEAWLLADRERLARFLAVPQRAVPFDPEAVASPKDAMAQLALRSRRRDIREDIAPRPRSGRRVGPAYSSRLIQFVADATQGWRPEIAAQSSTSLERCLRCLNRLIGRVSDPK
jgi:hypothetical protein